MLDREPNSVVVMMLPEQESSSRPAVADQVGGRKTPGMGYRKHLPRMGTLLRIDAPGSSEHRDRGRRATGSPHGASDRLRIDASFHLPGVPSRTVTRLIFRGAGQGFQPRWMPSHSERADSRCLGPFRTRPSQGPSDQNASSNRGRKSPSELAGKPRFPQALASEMPYIPGISSREDSAPWLSRSDR
jgi:hypothetical protein